MQTKEGASLTVLPTRKEELLLFLILLENLSCPSCLAALSATAAFMVDRRKGKQMVKPNQTNIICPKIPTTTVGKDIINLN